MKRTSQELLDFYGLKVGNVGKIEDELFRVMCDEDGVYLEFENEYGWITEEPLAYISDKEYTIIRTPQLTEDEKVILRNLPEVYKWIARDEDESVCVFTKNPIRENDYKYGNYWFGSMREDLRAFDHLFKFITWEDEPYLIEDLLKPTKQDEKKEPFEHESWMSSC